MLNKAEPQPCPWELTVHQGASCQELKEHSLGVNPTGSSSDTSSATPCAVTLRDHL